MRAITFDEVAKAFAESFRPSKIAFSFADLGELRQQVAAEKVLGTESREEGEVIFR
jgi:hypothetical protein